jgi:hypothetical protein
MEPQPTIPGLTMSFAPRTPSHGFKPTPTNVHTQPHTAPHAHTGLGVGARADTNTFKCVQVLRKNKDHTHTLTLARKSLHLSTHQHTCTPIPLPHTRAPTSTRTCTRTRFISSDRLCQQARGVAVGGAVWARQQGGAAVLGRGWRCHAQEHTQGASRRVCNTFV